jgi:transcriptional regulator GlxA family with amidase domain
MKRSCSPFGLLPLFLFAFLIMHACKPIQNLKQAPAAYHGGNHFTQGNPPYDENKKTVFIIADNKATEIFDMLASFYLFNATGKANVYIIAKYNCPIFIKQGLYVLPQLTFEQADSMNMPADVIVIPALSRRADDQDSVLISWIKKHFTTDTKMLAICDGASTAAATGFYDGIPITCHASDYALIKSHFSKPLWVQNVSVTKSGNLFSTAGVSNAVEGSLTVINKLFGRENMQKVSANIHYPHPEIQDAHRSIAVSTNTKLKIAKKVIFRKNRRIGLLLENGVNEFELAAIMDTYDRSLPASFKTFIVNNSTVQTKFGLTLIQTGDKAYYKLHELHILSPGSLSVTATAFFKDTKLVRYDNLLNKYPIDICLERISNQYGRRFGNVVKILLDYN